MNKTYADENVNMDYGFSLLSSFTKGIMTLPILLRGIQLDELNRCLSLKSVMRDFVGITWFV